MMKLPDIQNEKPTHSNIAINRVGISDFKLPIFISKKSGGIQHSVANIDCYVNLDSNLKGINMSRLPIGLQKFKNEQLNYLLIENICEFIRVKSEANECELSYHFPYFLEKTAPVSNETGVLPYNIIFTGIKTQNDFIFKINVETLTTSCCPCSREISDNGAHNQKCRILIDCTVLNIDNIIWIEDLIDIAESSSSCDIYSVLKRPDEKFVTENMYKNSKFVEDIARECYYKLDKLNNISNFSIKVESDESIHAHKALAIISS